MRIKSRNSLNPQGSPEKQSFEKAIQGQYLQGLMAKCVPDARSAKQLTADLLSIVTASEKLRECEPITVLTAALRGAAMGLMLGEEYYVVPFKSSATYILGYKGLLTLLEASGTAEDYDWCSVLDGEYRGIDPRTRRAIVDFSAYKNEDEMTGHPVVGYYFWVQLKSGRRISEYMSVEQILNHAQRFSKSFDRKTFDLLNSGELPQQEADRIREKSPWYSMPETMMAKTVIRKLLKSGKIRLAPYADMYAALKHEDNLDRGILPTIEVNPDTGELIEREDEAEPETPDTAALPPSTPENATVVDVTQRAEPARTVREPIQATQEPAQGNDAEFAASFFS